MSHEGLSILDIRAGHLQPRSVGSPKTAPVHKGQSHLSCHGFDMPYEHVAIPPRHALPDGLTHQIIRTARFHHWILSCCPARLHLNNDALESVYPLRYYAVYWNRGVAGFTLRRSPITA